LSCEEEPKPEGREITTEVPDDRLAFYVIENLSEELMYKALPVDSIMFFGERIIRYEEIISYDTVYFSFEIERFAVDRVAGINNKYNKWCLPFAVVCEGEIIFGAYLYHPLSSCFPYWFYTTAIRQDQFTIYAPVWTENPLKHDPRKDPRMIKVLMEDGKIKSEQTDQ
jgi:hypothetical protein